MSLRKILIVALGVSCSVSAFADAVWRWTSDGGAKWTEEKSTIFTVPALTGASSADNIIEFLADCTYTAALSFENVTLRSGSGGPYTLTRKANVKITVTGTSVITNLTLDCGCVFWNSDDYDLRGSYDSSVRGGIVIAVSSGAHLTLQSGATLQTNGGTTGESGSIVANGTFTMLDGSTIQNFRNVHSVVAVPAGGTFEMQGGLITKCFVDNSSGGPGVVYVSGGTFRLTGGKIVGNVSSSTSYGIVFVNSGTLYVSGSPLLDGNTLRDGQPLGIVTRSVNYLVQEGDLSSSARLAVTYPTTCAADAQFGTAGGDHTGADRFFHTSDPFGTYGTVTDGKLVWAIPALDTIAYVAPNVDVDSDGGSHAATVAVTEPASGATVTYATEQFGTYTTTSPLFAAAGDHTVWYKIEASGYKTVNGRLTLTITDTSQTIGYRWTVDGGAHWSRHAGTSFSLPDLTGATTTDNVVEFLADCALPYGISVPPPVTFRSEAGETNKVTSAANHATAFTPWSSCVISNLTLDGGVVWKNAKPTSTDRESTYRKRFFDIATDTALTLGAGATLQKMFCDENIGNGVIYMSGGTFTMLDGSRIYDIRANVPTLRIHGGTAYLDGGVIENCRANNSWPGKGVVQLSGGKTYLRGTKISGNQSSSASYPIVYPSAGTLYLSGHPVVFGNTSPNGRLNVMAANNNYIVQDGDLVSGAKVGLTNPNSAAQAVGVVFGSTTNATFAGTDKFCADSDPTGLIGEIDAETLQLKWKESTLSDIVYAATGTDAETNGLPHGISVAVADPPSGATITYATEESGEYSATMPTFTEPGDYVIWYQIEADGYKPATGYRFVTLVDPTKPVGYRYTKDGGSEWHRHSGTVFTLPSLDGATAADNVVEFMADCTSATDVLLSTPVTFRSEPGETNVLKFSTTPSAPNYAWYQVYTDMVISNLTVDGGAVWKDEKPTSIGRTTGNRMRFAVVNTSGHLTLGAGATIQKVFCDENLGYGVVEVIGGTFTMLDGSRFYDVRACVPVVYVDSGTVCLDGGVIENCYYSKSWPPQGIVGLWGGKTYLRGTTIRGNATSDASYPNVYPKSGTLYLSGHPVVFGNTSTLGALNVMATDSQYIVQDGDLESGAKVGITNPGSATQAAGIVFGTTTNATFAGTDRLRADTDPNGLVGEIDAETLKLKWKIPILEDLVYTAAGTDVETNGSPYGITVAVTTPSSGATVTYATERYGEYSATMPTFTEPGDYVIWYQIEADGYRAETGYRFVSLVDPTLPVGYRYTMDGGSEWHRHSGTNVTSFAFGFANDGNIVEFERDCRYTSAVTVANSAVIRSRPGVGRRTVWLKGDYTAYWAVSGDCVISNIVFDGGTRWKSSDPSQGDAIASGNGQARFLTAAVGATVTLGAGTLIQYYRNVESMDAVLICNGPFTMKPGAEISNCRGGSPVVKVPKTGPLTIEGGVIASNYCGNLNCTLGALYASDKINIRLLGGRIVKNYTGIGVTAAEGTLDQDQYKGMVELAGDLTVWGNFCGKVGSWSNRNVRVTHSSLLKVSGPISPASKIGVTVRRETASTYDPVRDWMEYGDAFGAADATATGVDRIRSDCGRLRAKKKDDAVVWSTGGLIFLVR